MPTIAYKTHRSTLNNPLCKTELPSAFVIPLAKAAVLPESSEVLWLVAVAMATMRRTQTLGMVRCAATREK